MGDVNQKSYLQKFHPVEDGPILEIGSKDHGGRIDHAGTTTFRTVYSANEYVGVDLEAGKGVDYTVDLVEGIGELPENHFALAICCSVMEHVARPWKMAENITRLVRPGGRLYISVPWVWRYHPYPDDYYRFSFRGIMQLFPEFDWAHIYYSTTARGEFLMVKESCLGIDHLMSPNRESPELKRKYLPYLMVNMLGTKLQTARQAA